MKTTFSIALFFLYVFFPVEQVFSQDLYTVSGFVFNTETGEMIPDANIIVAGTRQGTSSGANGQFELRLQKGNYNLRISSVGYTGKRILVNVPSDGASNLQIGLMPEKLGIEGVDIYGSLKIVGRDSSIDRAPLSLLPSITTISSDEIEKQGAVTLTDAVKYTPGAWTESRGRKVKQFFSVRGQKYPYPDYSINGIWQKEFEETSYFFSALDIESIEIVRSSSALVKGLSALTGVVDVKTRKPQHETASLLARYGEMNSYLSNLQYGNKVNDISYIGSASLFGTDGPSGRNGKERIANFHGNVDWEINPKVKLTTGASYIHGFRQLERIVEPGSPKFLNREEEYNPLNTLLSYAKLDYHANDGSHTEFQTNFSYRDADYSNFNIPQETTTSYEEKDWEYGFNLLHSRALSSSNTLRIGGLYNHWKAPNGKRYYVGRSSNVHTLSAVIADEQRVGRFLFDAGLRVISGYIVEWGGFSIEGSAAGFQNVAPVMDEPLPFEWQSVFGTSWILSRSLSLHYNFAGGSIAPRRASLNEEGMLPEKEIRLQHDLGLRYQTMSGNEISISSFYTTGKNAIELSGETVITENDMVVELYENTDKRSYGIEFVTRWNIPLFHSYFFANALLMKGEKKVDSDFKEDEKLPGLILNTGIYFEYAGFDANLFVNYTGPYTNNRFVAPAWINEHGDFPLGDFVLADFTAGYTFSGKISKRVFVEVKNLLDKEYFTVAGYPDPGRMLHAGFKLSF